MLFSEFIGFKHVLKIVEVFFYGRFIDHIFFEEFADDLFVAGIGLQQLEYLVANRVQGKGIAGRGVENEPGVAHGYILFDLHG
jgi:hypothetical protein